MDKANKIVQLRTLAAFYRLEQMTEAQAASLFALYRRVLDALLKDLEKTADKKKALAMIKAATDTLDALAERLTQSLEKATEQSTTVTLAAMRDILSWDGRNPAYKNVLTTTEALVAAAMKQSVPDGLSSKISDWMTALVSKPQEVIKEMARAIVRGENPLEVASDLVKELKEITEESKRNLRTLARTYMLAAGHQARRAVYEANKEIINMYQWEATLEGGNVQTGRGTCVRCAALDGKQYEKESETPPIPLHPNCRCTLIPITRNWESILGKEVDIDTEYDRWYRNVEGKGNVGFDRSFVDHWEEQDKNWQDRAIGPERADLVRSGRAKFEELVNDDGSLIPVKTLKKRK